MVEWLPHTCEALSLVLNSQSVFLFSSRERDLEKENRVLGLGAVPLEGLAVVFEEHTLVGMSRGTWMGGGRKKSCHR